MCMDKRKRTHYDWDEVQRYHDAGNGVRATIEHFGMSSRTWNKAVQRGAVKSNGPKPLTLDELLVADRPQTSRTYLKTRLIKEGVLEYKCAICGISDWLGEPLSLHLDHKNGVHDDNRLENLWLLCPNCHDQQPTSNGKNKKYKRCSLGELADPPRSERGVIQVRSLGEQLAPG